MCLKTAPKSNIDGSVLGARHMLLWRKSFTIFRKARRLSNVIRESILTKERRCLYGTGHKATSVILELLHAPVRLLRIPAPISEARRLEKFNRAATEEALSAEMATRHVSSIMSAEHLIPITLVKPSSTRGVVTDTWRMQINVIPRPKLICAAFIGVKTARMSLTFADES
jgi:hypothetical protein